MSTTQPQPADATPAMRRILADHQRHWLDYDFVYPVVSRRSRGLSIGVNLNPDTACSFDCPYCLVDRSQAPPRRDVDLAQMHRELDSTLTAAVEGEIWRHERFAGVDPAYRRLNDIAFSGNGEPTLFKRFDEAVRIAVDLRAAHALDSLKLIVITNATGLHRKQVQDALTLLDAERDEIWAKLDAGTEEYYQQINRSNVPLAKVLDNIRHCGGRRPVVIQSLFVRLHGQAASDAEFDAYVQRLATLIEQGCRIRQVQLCTLARPPAESYVTALSGSDLDQLAATLRRRLGGLPVEVFKGVD